MSVMEIFEVLKNNNMSIGVSDGKLKVVDPEQKITSELREKIKNNKNELIRVLSKKDSYTVADFPCATMSDTDFQEIKKDYPTLQDVYIATALQKGMFFHETFAGRETCYSRQIFFDMEGEVDIQKLQQAWQHVIDRHEILRACFVGFAANEIHQLVDKTSGEVFEVIDQRHASPAEQTSFLTQLHAQDRLQRFDYAEPSLLRIKIVQLSAQRTHLLCSYHHAILDGWSIPILLAEVSQCYEALRSAQEVNLAPVVPFSRYIDWLSSRNEGEAENFWRAHLDGFTPPRHLQFPELPEQGNSSFGTIHLAIDSQLSQQLIAYCAKTHSTMNSFLHLAWSYTLGRFLNLDDVVVGSATSVRPSEIANVEKMLGLLINTVPVRVKLKPSITIAEALTSLGQHSADSTDYRYFPLDKLQSALGFSSKLPLFESLLVFQNYPDYGKSDGDQLTQNISLQNTGYSEENNFAVTVIGSMIGERLSLELAHDERVSGSLAQAMADHLLQTLQRIVSTDPSVSLGALDEPSTFTASAARKPVASSVLQLIDAQASKTPKSTAISYDFESITYQQLLEKANRLGNYLVFSGVYKNDVIAVFMDRSIELAVCLLAILKTGASYLLLDSSEPDERVHYKLKESGAAGILTDEQSEDGIQYDGIPKIVINASKVAKGIARSNTTTPVPIAGPRKNTDFVAYLNFVSDASGYPKVSSVSHDTLTNVVEWYNQRATPQANKSVLCGAPVLVERFSLELFATLCEGAEVLLVNDVLDLCINSSLTPSTLSLTMDDLRRLLTRRFTFEGVRTIALYDGARIAPHMKRLIEEFGVEIVDVYLAYGECAMFAAYTRVTRANVAATFQFAAIEGHTQLRVLDLHGRSQPVGAIGELHLAYGTHSIATGDVVRRLENDAVELVRKSPKHFEVAGHHVLYEELEFHIKKIDGVANAAVLMRNDDNTSEQLVGYLALTNGFTGSANSYVDDEQFFEEVHHVKSYLLGKLPAILVPETYAFVEKLPEYANGEIDKASLRSPEEISNEKRNYVPPKNSVEEHLLELWEGGFLLNGISCSDDYFELGGSSLLQVKLGARINKDFGTDIPLADLFNSPMTVIKQAELVNAALAAKK